MNKTRLLKSIYIIKVVLVAGLLFSIQPAMAAFDLSIAPDRGVSDIRFRPAKAGREVRNEEALFTVTNDTGSRYRIIQREFITPTSAEGHSLNTGSIQFFSPTSVNTGDLEVVYPQEIDRPNQEIYTSDNSGTAVAFRLAYHLEVAADQPGGYYQGQVVYELQDTTGRESPVSVVIYISVNIDADFRIEVTGLRGGAKLDLGRVTKENPEGQGAINLSIPTSPGDRYRIYQQLIRPLISEEAEEIGADQIVFEATSTSGQVPAGTVSLSNERILIFESDKSGSAADITINYSTRSTERKMAGFYEGTLHFIVESASPVVSDGPIIIPVQLEVESLFYLDVTYETGGGLNFGRFRESGEEQGRKVLISVFDNSGQPYQVVQNILRPFTNESGDTIDFKHFKARTTGAESGTMHFLSETEQKEGFTPIYTSDNEGTPDSFEVQYMLSLPKGATKGDYSSETTYSLSPL